MKHYLFCFLFEILLNVFCYAPNTAASPIINGSPDERHHFKFHVSIHRKQGPANEYRYFCGGSIISERYILSVAHCFITIVNDVMQEVFYPRGTTKIIAGTNHWNGLGIERDVIRVFIPAGPDIPPNSIDLSVVELSADLGVHQHPDRLAIMPLEALDPHSNVGVNRRSTFCGFGYDILTRQRNGVVGPASSGNTINRFMNARILGRNECPTFETSICVRNADTEVFRTACFGDSGSGLIYDYKIVGVLSNGPRNCDTLGPILFTRLYGNMRFIEQAQNPRGDHGSMHVLDERPKSFNYPSKGPRNPEPSPPNDGSSSSSTKGKRRILSQI